MASSGSVLYEMKSPLANFTPMAYNEKSDDLFRGDDWLMGKEVDIIPCLVQPKMRKLDHVCDDIYEINARSASTPTLLE